MIAAGADGGCESGSRLAAIPAWRRWLATWFGAFLCLMLSAAFFPAQLGVDAQTSPKPGNPADWSTFNESFRGVGSTAFCGTSEGLVEFKKINQKHWAAIPPKNVPKNLDDSRAGFFLTLRIISCMIGTQPGDGARGLPGVIIFYGRAAIAATANMFTNVILTVALLALVLLGVRVALGRHTEFLPSLFVILLKIGLLLAAVAAIPSLYEALVATINGWSGDLALSIPSALCKEYTRGAILKDYLFLAPWAKLDCAAQSIIEVGANTKNSPAGVMMTAFLSSFLGKGVAAAFMAEVYSIAVVMEVSITIMILAHMAIILLMMIAPLAWACLFFQKTRDYFTRWLGMLAGFTLQPILLCLFLMMLVNIYESVMCKSHYSVVGALNEAADNLKITKTPPVPEGGGNYPDPGTPFGDEHCSVPMINRAFQRIGQNAKIHDAVTAMTTAQASADDTLQQKGTISSIVQGALETLWTPALDLIQKLSGAKFPGIGAYSLDDATAKAMAKPFLAMLTAFIIMFVLFHFLRQLPEFVNLLAAAAVDSGDINKVTRIGGEFGQKAAGGVGSMNRGFEQGLRGADGSMGQAQNNLAAAFKGFAGKG